MTSQNLRNIALTWLLPIVILLGINMAFLNPLYFGGKVLDQDDIKLGWAKTKESRDYRQATGEEPLWTNSMFSGMPTAQLGAQYAGNIFDYVQKTVSTIGGSNSSSYIIFYLMIAAFIGLRGMGVNHWLSTLGGFAYGYSGFYIIGYAAGHNAKVNTAAFIPLMVLGMLLILERKNWRAFALMTLFAGLSIHRNHFQVTYYTTLLLGVIWVVYLIQYAKQKALPEFAKYTGLLLLAGVIALGPNVANIWSTKVYTGESMRGGTSELTQKNQNQGEGGLSFDYAMMWSTGLYETVAMVIPDAAGGGIKVDYSGKGLETFDQLTRGQKRIPESQLQQMNQYMGYALMKWTGDSMGNGAYYMGAGIFFLFVLAFFTVGGPMRTWVAASTVLFLLMSWGQNAAWFNKLLFNYLPLYNKFRVPSMALVGVFFMVPFYGLFGLDRWFKLDKAARNKTLLKAGAYFGGFIVLFGLIAPYLMNLEGARDGQLAQQGFDLSQIIDDRRSLITSSALRSLVFGGLTFGALYLWQLDKLNQYLAIGVLSAVTLVDLLQFDRDQLGDEEYLTQREWDAQYAPNAANAAISQDPDPHFRVWNTTAPLASDSYTSYHHKSIGGYHGAKLQRYQDLIDNQLNNQNMGCFSMLNAKYFIVQTQDGNVQAQRNPNACGNAWAIPTLQVVPDADAEMAALTGFNPRAKAIVDQRYSDYLGGQTQFADASVQLSNYDPKRMVYSFKGGDAFVVFSEIYYEGSGNDWQAYLDGEPVEHIRVNYLLRGMKVPTGEHEIVFAFEPESYYTGVKINYAGSGLIVALLIWFGWSSRKKEEA